MCLSWDLWFNPFQRAFTRKSPSDWLFNNNPCLREGKLVEIRKGQKKRRLREFGVFKDRNMLLGIYSS